jgi:hypothetical protein
MKAVCPISGIPFRTYDSLPVKVSYIHPIFSLTYEQLVYLLDIIKDQDLEIIKSITSHTEENYQFMDSTILAKRVNNSVTEAIQEGNYHNPVFKLHQTKALTMLAFMKLSKLLENEDGYIARPSPSTVSAYFWQATELFIWAASIRNPYMIEALPKYRISKHNEDMGNFSEYINILSGVKQDLSNRYRSMADENKLRSMEHALAILSKRRDIYKQELTKGNNKLAAHWALMITRPPKEIKDFWFAILSSPSLQITFEGVEVNNKMEPVYKSDLNELREFLEDNLIGPRGVDKSEKATHDDDNEHYFIARQTVLSIVRKHIAILEQGTAGYQIINVALGCEILSATDDELHEKAIQAGLEGKPLLTDYSSQGKIGFMKAMARWRLSTKQELITLSNMNEPPKHEEGKKGGINYEIL